MLMTEAHRKANKKWNDANIATRYDRLVTLPPAGCKALVLAAAKEEGLSVSSFIQLALLDRMGLDAWPT
jgi:hypothetical protein